MGLDWTSTTGQDQSMGNVRSGAKTALFGFFVSLIVTAGLVIAGSVLVGEVRMDDAIQLNQWLARDIASQFSAQGARYLAKAQRYGALTRMDRSGFDTAAEREFAIDTTDGGDIPLQAIYLYDAGAANPLAKLEKPDAAPTADRALAYGELAEGAIRDGVGVESYPEGMTAFALKLGDAPKVLVMITSEPLIARASGGPRGEKWMLLAAGPKTPPKILREATAERISHSEFPNLDDVRKFFAAENPAGERTEFSHDYTTDAGVSFRLTGIQTGVFGVTALAISPVDNSFTFLATLAQIGIGISIAVALFLLLIQTARARRSHSPVETSPEMPN